MGPSPNPPGQSPYAPSSLPPPMARALAFASILVGGLCGGLIGYALADIAEAGGLLAGLSGLAGAAIGAFGVGIVAVLALRAMGEWHDLQREGRGPGRDRRRRH